MATIRASMSASICIRGRGSASCALVRAPLPTRFVCSRSALELFKLLCRMFRIAILLLLLVCFLQQAALGATSDSRKVTKLQIGIKKRVENCEHKSAKGDILHIHYRVGFFLDTQMHCPILNVNCFREPYMIPELNSTALTSAARP